MFTYILCSESALQTCGFDCISNLAPEKKQSSPYCYNLDIPIVTQLGCTIFYTDKKETSKTRNKYFITRLAGIYERYVIESNGTAYM